MFTSKFRDPDQESTKSHTGSTIKYKNTDDSLVDAWWGDEFQSNRAGEWYFLAIKTLLDPCFYRSMTIIDGAYDRNVISIELSTEGSEVSPNRIRQHP